MAHYNLQRLIDYFNISLDEDGLDTQNKGHIQQIGRASCREEV